MSANDPRNKLPDFYLDIVAELQKWYEVEFIVFENVLGIRDKKHAHTYKSIVRRLRKLGMKVTEHLLCALDFGVPQTRKRIVLSAVRDECDRQAIQLLRREGPSTVREAIGDLCPPVFFRRGLNPNEIPLHPNHWTMQPKSERFSSDTKSLKGGRSFRRLNWDKPSPTIAFGHREINVHPNGQRRLSIFEAMLLQGFPSSFVLEGNLTQQVEQVSNAVPPPLSRSIAAAVKKSVQGN